MNAPPVPPRTYPITPHSHSSRVGRLQGFLLLLSLIAASRLLQRLLFQWIQQKWKTYLGWIQHARGCYEDLSKELHYTPGPPAFPRRLIEGLVELKTCLTDIQSSRSLSKTVALSSTPASTALLQQISHLSHYMRDVLRQLEWAAMPSSHLYPMPSSSASSLSEEESEDELVFDWQTVSSSFLHLQMDVRQLKGSLLGRKQFPLLP